MDVDAVRAQIPATGSMTYLNTGWAGPTPAPVLKAVEARLRFEVEQGPTTPEVRESGAKIKSDAKSAVAELINASPEEVLLTQNTTEGLNIVMGGLEWSAGDEVVTFGLEHASPQMAAFRLAQRWGVKVKRVPIATDAPHDAVIAALDEALTERTRAVMVSHIEYSSGLRMPVKAIGELVKPRGVLVIVDGAQTAGHVQVDVRDLDCDAYSTSGQKWLLGPDGTGALYVKRSLIPQLRPRKLAFDNMERIAVGYSKLDEDDIELFQGSTASTPLRIGYLEAVRFIQSAGVPEIEARDMALADALRERLTAIPKVTVTSPTKGPGRSGLVTFTVDGADPKQVAETLWERDRILVRDVPYPPAVRASLHFFNTEDEVARLAVVVEALARGL